MSEADLPEIYAEYFGLRALGWRRVDIVERLDIALESAETFIELAHAKLATSDLRD